MKIGMFDDRLISGGDLEFGKRAYDSHIRQELFEDIKLFHPTRFRFGQLVKKTIRVNKGIAQLYYYHHEKFQNLYKSLFKIEHYRPHNPLKTREKFRCAGIKVSTGEAIIGTVLFFSLNIIGQIALVNEYYKLRKK
jgi:hypothetical protein